MIDCHTLRVGLFILVAFAAVTQEQDFGSCRDAGISACCTTDECAGSSGTCYCDLQCYSFDDCCNDIAKTCPVPDGSASAGGSGTTLSMNGGSTSASGSGTTLPMSGGSASGSGTTFPMNGGNASASGSGTTLPMNEFLSYIQLDSTPGVTRNSVFGDDACSSAITIPIIFHFGDLKHSTAYVCTNGLISFGNPRTDFSPTLFTSTNTIQFVVAPFWADINVNDGGNIWYETHNDSTSAALLTQVNEFIQTQQQNNFTGTWMLVAEWNNVPEFGSPSQRNTFQGLIITDGFQSYTVFTYQCGDINWAGGATIGFQGDADFFVNHPNSGIFADSIDCQGSATGNNVVYQLGGVTSSLSYIQLDSTPGVIRNSVFGDDACSSAITIPVDFHFGDLKHSTAYVCTNGLISFGNPRTDCCPSPFTSTSMIQSVVAPFWADINVNDGGNIWYETHTNSTSAALLTQVNEFIQTQHSNVFTGTWMLVAEWNNVPEFGSPSPRNTFQGLIITDGFQSYTVFTYQCGDINWAGGATIGFHGDDDFFINHPNSGNLADVIDCQESATGNNVVYQLDCTDGGIRVSNQEFLEVCINNTWIRICTEFLGDIEASVACQQLGYSVGEDAAILFSEENDTSTALINDVICSGGESRLIDCLVPSSPIIAERSCFYSKVNCTDIIVGLIEEEYTASEGESVEVCAILNQIPSRRVVVGLATVDSVTIDMDQIQPQVLLVFEPGTADQLLCADIPVVDDEIFERNEVMIVVLITPDQAVQLDPQFAFITISDNDVVTVQLLTTNYIVAEETGSFGVSVQKEGETAVDFNVTLSVMPLNGITAEAIEDFPAVSTIVTFSPGSTMVFQIIMINDDNIALEGEEQFIVAVTSAEPNILIGEVNTSGITILDNDRVQVQFSNSSYEVNEDNGTVTVCVVKDMETAIAFNVTVTSRETRTIEAEVSRDFVPTAVPFTFPAGSDNTACGQFQVIADGVALEDDEQFVVQLSVPSLITLQGIEGSIQDSLTTGFNCIATDMVASSAIITIIDTDVVTLNFSSEVYVVNEGTGPVQVCLEKDKDTAIALRIGITAGELDRAEAKVNEDFTSISLNITFPEVDHMTCVEIPIIDDLIVSEGDEQFIVTFTVFTPGVETGVPNISYVTIIDNDMPTPQSSTSASLGGRVAGGVAGACITLLVVIVIVVVRHKKKKKYVPGELELEEIARQNSYVQFNQRILSVESEHIQDIPPEILIPNSILRLLDSVGEGEFGLVYRGEIVHPLSTERVAVKTLKGFFDQNQINDMLKESLKMWKFNHPNVMTLIGVCIDGGPTPYIVMPFMDNGSLYSYLKKERSKFVIPAHADNDSILSTSKKLIDMCIQVAKGMEYLARQKFVHKDLAARNCMIDLHFVIKIADFGMSENIYDRNYVRKGKDDGGKLPIKWMALESLTDLVFSEKTDVWAFGVTCWEVFSGGKIPYPAIDPVSLLGMIQNGYRAEKPNNAACTDAMYSIMLECWKENPDERPTFSQLVFTISTQLEGLAGYLDVGIFRDLQSSDETSEGAMGAEVIKNLHSE